MSNDLRVNLIGDASKLNASLNKASSKLKAFGKSATKIGKDLSLKLTLPIALAAGASIKLASDFQESLNKVDVAFGKSSNAVREFAKTTLDEFGIAESSALDMAAMFGDMSTSMGLSTQKAAELSTSMVGLAGDLASFKNIGIEQATTALAGVFTGETETLKKLGIVMTEANLKFFALDQGIQTNIKNMTQAQKVTLRYQYILSQTGNAQGDFKRTQEGAANQMRIFTEGMKELGVEIGQVLLPAFTKIVKFANTLIKKFKGLSDNTKKIIVVVALLVAAIGPALIAIGAMSSLIGIAMTGFAAIAPVLVLVKAKFIALTIAMMANPFVAIATAIVALTGYIVIMANKMAPLISKWQTFKNMLKSGGSMSKFAALQLADQAEAQRKLDEETKNNIDSKDKETIALDKNTIAFENNSNAQARGKVGTVNSGLGNKRTFEPIVGVAQSGMDPATQLANSIGNGNILLQGKLTETKTLLTESQREYLNNADMFNQELGSVFEGGLENLAVGIGEALGNAISTGGNLGQQLGAVLLGTLGGVAMQIGKMAIGIGIALEGIKKALTSLNPFVAIAAGIALVALGSIFQSQSAKIGQGMGKSGPKEFAKGGIVSSPTLGLMGEYPGARSNPEVIAPLDKLKNMIGDRGSSTVQVGGQFTLKGQDLVVALQRAGRNRNRVI